MARNDRTWAGPTAIRSPRASALIRTVFKRVALFWLCGLSVLGPQMFGYSVPQPLIVIACLLGVVAWVWTALAMLELWRQTVQDFKDARNPKIWKP